MDAIITTDSRQRILSFNPAAEKVFGCRASEAIGGPLERFIPQRYRSAHAEHVQRFGETGATTRHAGALGQLSALRANGEEFPIEASISHVEIGGKQSYTVILRDITRRKQAEIDLCALREAAEAANRAKDDFLAALSHELRTPLTPVLLLAEAMEQSDGMPEHLRSDLALMRKNIELEAHLIDDLLDITRIAHGKLHLEIETANVHSLLHQSLDFLKDDIRAKEHRVGFDLSAPAYCVQGDVVRLQQVFWNIMRNAIKFTPQGGEVMVRTRIGSPDTLRVEIADTGVGILSEDLGRIFQTFTQGSDASNRRFGGLGLGLSISQMIVEKHDGRIWAESDGKNRGATFFIELPLAVVELVRPAAVSEPVSLPKALRILLVEDNEPTRTTLARLLARRDHDVSPAETMASARALFECGGFDLVISDIGLPDGSGYDLMREIARIHPIPGIALSGYGMEEDIRRSRESGFVDHLTKPVEMAALDRAIARAIHS